MKIFLVILTVILIVLCMVSVFQTVFYSRLDRQMQLDKFGFVKNDVSMLTVNQQTARNIWATVALLSLLIVATIIIVFIIEHIA